MKTRTRIRLVAPIVLLALTATACGGGDGGTGSDAKPDAAAEREVKQGGSITYASEKNPTNFNTLSSEGNVFDTQVIVNPIWPAAYTQLPDFSVELNEDLLESAEVTKEDPQTITYKIKPEAAWSDGVPITADDFVYIFNTSNGKDTKYDTASTAGYDQISSVTGSDNGKTVTVEFSEPYADWQGLFGVLLPAHYMKTLGEPHDAFNSGLTGAKTVGISGGPYVLETYESDKQVVLKKNDKWYGKAANLDTVVFRILTDAAVEPQALANDEVQVIAPQPQIDLVQQVKKIQGVKSETGFGPIFEHFDFNLKNPALADVALRKALFTAVDRQQIVDATVKQFTDEAEVLNTRMLVKGQDGFQDNVTSEGLGGGDVEAAKKILTDAGYTLEGGTLKDKAGKAVPPLRMKYSTGNQVRQQECELFQKTASELGVKVNIETTDDLGGVLAGGDFDVIVFAWVGTPFPNSANKPLYTTGGGSNYNGYSNPQVDAALKEASMELDSAKAREKLNEADLQITKDAVTLPLYQKPSFLAYKDTYGNINNNSTSVGITYNIQSWGLIQ